MNRQRFKLTCGNCDIECVISVKAAESVVQPLHCPFCGDGVDDEPSDEWPDSEGDSE